MAFRTITTVLSAAVATAGTFTLAYPAGITATELSGSGKIGALGTVYTSARNQVGIAGGASLITVTYKGGVTLPAGTQIAVEIDLFGERADALAGLPDTVVLPVEIEHDFGVVAASDADGICLSQTTSGAANLVIAGALATAGVATLDIERCVALTSTANLSAITFTIRGTDRYGNALTATIAGPNNNTVFSTKCFKTVTQVSSSATVGTAVTAGSENRFGLPYALDHIGDIVRGKQDAINDAMSTNAVGDKALATAATGDVRGYVVPTNAPNATRAYRIVYRTGLSKGVGQFTDA